MKKIAWTVGLLVMGVGCLFHFCSRADPGWFRPKPIPGHSVNRPGMTGLSSTKEEKQALMNKEKENYKIAVQDPDFISQTNP